MSQVDTAATHPGQSHLGPPGRGMVRKDLPRRSVQRKAGPASGFWRSELLKGRRESRRWKGCSGGEAA